MNKLTKGDYVLATKYKDGSPMDEWCVGFYNGMLGDRFMVVDSQDNNFRGNGFRRVKKITQSRGIWLLQNKDNIVLGKRSLWGWVRATMQHVGKYDTAD